MEDLKNNTRLREQLRHERFTSKEELLVWILETKNRILKKAETDKLHSAAFYHVYENLLNKFEEKIKKTVLFEHLEDCWYYAMSITYSGAQLSLCHANKGKIGEEGQVVVTEDQHFRLVTVDTKLLTVDDYANTYGVNTGTVRQWIRRGKIRNAIKLGNEWRIPELTDMPTRGYQTGIYMWMEYLKNLPKEYEFLRNYTTAMFDQDSIDKNKFRITFVAQGVKPKYIICDTQEREKIELFMISHPQIQYFGLPEDGLNISISCKDETGEFLSKRKI